MKAILTYDLPEEQTEFQLAVDGDSWRAVVRDLDQWLRAQKKYQDKKTVSVEETRDKIRELMEEHSLNFDA